MPISAGIALCVRIFTENHTVFHRICHARLTVQNVELAFIGWLNSSIWISARRPSLFLSQSGLLSFLTWAWSQPYLHLSLSDICSKSCQVHAVWTNSDIVSQSNKSVHEFFFIAHALSDDQPACVNTLRCLVDYQVGNVSSLILALPWGQVVLPYVSLDIVPRSYFVFVA